MEQISPTRMALLQKRNQKKLAEKGADLLKKKRDALVAEFFELVGSALASRERLSSAAKEAYLALFLAKAFDGPAEVEALALGVPPIEQVRAEVENVWGTKVPRFEVAWPERVMASLIATGGQTLAAQRAFRDFAEALVAVANTETRLKMIGEEIKKTTRRVNALEQVVIPGLDAQIRYIRQVLEQREREDNFRLKKIKSKMEARAAEAAREI